MKARKSRLSRDSNGDCAFYVDLNDPIAQEKMVNYIKYGVPASDTKHGHHIRLQCKVTPVQADILQSLKEKAPGNYWKSQSDQLRSVIALGTFVISKFLNEAQQIPSLKKEFQLLDVINMISRKVREGELTVEARKAIYGINTNPFDVDKMLEDLHEAHNQSSAATRS